MLDSNQPRYPASLGTLLLEGPLPWDEALTIGMHHFIEQYTLHDSLWEGLWLEPAYGEATAVIRWDTFWAEGRVFYPEEIDEESQTAKWPILLIRFNPIYQVLWRNPPRSRTDTSPDIIMWSDSVHVSTQQRDQSLTSELFLPYGSDDKFLHLLDEDLHHTRIAGLEDEHIIEILHSGPVSLLCYHQTGELLPMPLQHQQHNSPRSPHCASVK